MAKEELKKIEELEKKANEYLAGWQRARADYLNFKKEEIARMGQIVRYATEELILKILPVLDNFERAEAQTPPELKNDQHFKGLLQIKKQIKDLLKSFGVEEIKALGQKFDPNFHEVVGSASAEAAAGKEADTIIEVVQKGYILQGNVIRPAKVKIIK